MFIDLFQGTEALIVIGPAIQEPIAGGGLGGGSFYAGADCEPAARRKDEQSEQQQTRTDVAIKHWTVTGDACLPGIFG
ncbi:MAG TPA: hypothetical protein VFO27_05590, partial [Bryobacteraceae bacterium]|nr:hypothetical protein [Bryobacteraceae bacterium]